MTYSPRRDAATQIITGLPVFGSWVNAISEYDTPYGRVGARQIDVLWALRHGLIDECPVTASAITQYLNVQPSVVTRLLAKLEASGFIERIGLPSDRRASEIRVTDLGEMIGQFVEDLYYEEVLAVLESFSDDEVEQLRVHAERLHAIGVKLLTDRKQRSLPHMSTARVLEID